MEAFPLSVISSFFGKKSETFIHRHMRQLLPGKTAVIVRELVADSGENDIPSPCCIFGARRNLSWFYHGSRYCLGLSKFSPTQVVVASFLKHHGVQVILSEYLDQSLKWLEVAHNLGIRFFAHAHGYDISKTLRDPGKCQSYLRLKSADGIITVSEYSRKKLMDIGLDESKIHVIPCGINVLNAPISRSSRKIIRCLAVGRMVGKKAPLFLLESFRKALVVFPNLHLDFIGDGFLFEDVKRYIRLHDLKKQVTLHGSQPNSVVQTMMKNSDIFIQHSRTDPETGDEEGLPVAILEAMGNGLPVVSTKHAGIPEAVLHGETGYLSSEDDTERMSQYIVKLSKDFDLRNTFGQAGWKRAMKYFTWELERNNLIELLGLT